MGGEALAVDVVPQQGLTGGDVAAGEPGALEGGADPFDRGQDQRAGQAVDEEHLHDPRVAAECIVRTQQVEEGVSAVRMNRTALPVLLMAVLAVFTAQQALTPVLAPLAREVGLSAVALGWVMTVAAVFFALTSLVWGRGVDAWGHRRVLLVGLGVALVGLVGFAVVSQLALAGRTSPAVTLLLMMATRSVLFGAGIGAVPVAAMAYVAATTAGGRDRTRGIGQLGAVQGVAVALGPALGGLLAFAGLLGPVWLAPAVVALALVVVAVALPAAQGRSAGADADGGSRAAGSRPLRPLRPLRPWDRRLWPLLLVGFLIFLTLGLILIILGFLFQDRLGLDAAATARATSAALFATGVVLVAAQGVLVPRLGWPPVRLMRTGVPIAAVGLLALVLAPEFWSMTASLTLLALGMGLAVPGYTTAPTLLVGPDEQGGVAGLVNATTGASFVVGPLAGTALYEVRPELPALGGAVLCAVAGVFVLLHPGVRRVASDPGPATTGAVPGPDAGRSG